MHQGSGDHSELKHLAIRVGIYVGVFVAGGAATFAYSYKPLYNAKNWKIDYLEDRLRARGDAITDLEAQLAQLETQAEDGPSRELLERVQGDLSKARAHIGDTEKKLTKSTKRITELERVRDKWKNRYEEADSARSEIGSKLASLKKQASEPPAAAPASTWIPEAPFPAAIEKPLGTSELRPVATGVEVRSGDGWASSDGRTRFELVDVVGGEAQISPDPNSLSAGGKPTIIGIAEGGQFWVGLSSGNAHQVRVTRIDGTRAIYVDISQ